MIEVYKIIFADNSKFIARTDKEGWQDIIVNVTEQKRKEGIIVEDSYTCEMEEEDYLKINMKG